MAEDSLYHKNTPNQDKLAKNRATWRTKAKSPAANSPEGIKIDSNSL